MNKIWNWIKSIFKPTKQKEVVELTAKQQKILRKHKGQ